MSIEKISLNEPISGSGEILPEKEFLINHFDSEFYAVGIFLAFSEAVVGVSDMYGDFYEMEF